MRSLLTSATTIALLILASALAATKPSCASTVINACGKFSFWVPDDWKAWRGARVSVEESVFESGDGNLYVSVGPLSDKSAELTDDNVKAYVEEFYKDVKVTSDKKDVIEKFQVRLMEGRAKEDGDPISFKLLALDPGTDEGVLLVVVSGAPRGTYPVDSGSSICSGYAGLMG